VPIEPERPRVRLGGCGLLSRLRQAAELEPSQRPRTGHDHPRDGFARRCLGKRHRRLTLHRLDILQPRVDPQQGERNRSHPFVVAAAPRLNPACGQTGVEGLLHPAGQREPNTAHRREPGRQRRLLEQERRLCSREQIEVMASVRGVPGGQQVGGEAQQPVWGVGQQRIGNRAEIRHRR
jgi:hypothetical protein